MEKLEPIHNLLILDKILRENHSATINWVGPRIKNIGIKEMKQNGL